MVTTIVTFTSQKSPEDKLISKIWSIWHNNYMFQDSQIQDYTVTIKSKMSLKNRHLVKPPNTEWQLHYDVKNQQASHLEKLFRCITPTLWIHDHSEHALNLCSEGMVVYQCGLGILRSWGEHSGSTDMMWGLHSSEELWMNMTRTWNKPSTGLKPILPITCKNVIPGWSSNMWRENRRACQRQWIKQRKPIWALLEAKEKNSFHGLNLVAVSY